MTEIRINTSSPYNVIIGSGLLNEAGELIAGAVKGRKSVIVTDDIDCPMDENSVLFVDKKPEFDSDGNPIFDYIVKKVARSLNFASYAISKVNVS